MATIQNMSRTKAPHSDFEKNDQQSEQEKKEVKKQSFKDAFDLEEKQQKLAKLKQRISKVSHVPIQAGPLLKEWFMLAFTITAILKANKIEHELKMQKQKNPINMERNNETIYQNNLNKHIQEITDISKKLPDPLKNDPEIKSNITNLLQEVANLQTLPTHSKQQAVSLGQKTFDQAKAQAILSSNQQTNQNHQTAIQRKDTQQLAK